MSGAAPPNRSRISAASWRSAIPRREERRPKVACGLATAFGCTIEGAVDEDRVRRIAVEVAEAGADAIILADTVGYGQPAAVERVFRRVMADVAPLPVSGHFHDTRGLGLTNVLAALNAGARSFDASLGGLGGCPYAPGATGNIVTEDLAFMLEAMGFETGIDIDRLVAVRELVHRPCRTSSSTAPSPRPGCRRISTRCRSRKRRNSREPIAFPPLYPSRLRGSLPLPARGERAG